MRTWKKNAVTRHADEGVRKKLQLNYFIWNSENAIFSAKYFGIGKPIKILQNSKI